LPDIFLSYSRDDVTIARRFAEGFEREGFSVWWDATLNPGEAFDQAIEKALDEAKAVVVLWSKNSVGSRWVRAEATQANHNGTLVPVMVEPCKRPIIFELMHTADLGHWNGDPNDKAWQSYIAGVRRVVAKDASTAPAAPVSRNAQTISAKALGVLVAVVVIAGGAWWALLVKRGDQANVQPALTATGAPTAAVVQSAPSVVPSSSKLRIAILPFENLSPDPKNAFFTDGLHEEIISTLANRAQSLEVISRTTMMLYRTTPKAVEEIARELGATHVLEGSVRREGNEVRLTLQLIDARNDKHIWSQDFDRTLTNALRLQSEVAEQVAGQLTAQLGGRAAQSGQLTTDPQAYDLYLKARIARGQLKPDSTLADALPITDVLLAAIKRDPNFALARVELANHYLQLYQSGYTDDVAILARTREQLDAAQALIPGDPVLVVTQAYGDYLTSASTRPLTPAVQLALANTQDTLNLQVAQVLFDQQGRFADSLEMFQRLSRLDPANVLLMAINIWELECLRRPQEALQLVNLVSSRPDGATFKAHRARLLFDYTGRMEELQNALDRVAPSLQPEARFWFEDNALRFAHRYRDLIKHAEQFQPETITPDIFGLASPLAMGPVPRGEPIGWAAMLLNDPATARKQAAVISTFLSHSTKPTVQAWYEKALLAEADLFAGARKEAIDAAQQSLALRPREEDALTWVSVATVNARVLAWAGAQDQAVQLLEELSTVDNGLAPAEITRDPLYDLPLANNPRYQALKSKLEAQIAAVKLE
jgi:TolB-like protein